MALATADYDPARLARRLLRAGRVATLATSAPVAAQQTLPPVQPFASLVTPAVAPDGSVLLLISDLSEHTRHLRNDGRCSLLIAGPAVEANPQTAPRLAITGTAELAEQPALKARYLAVHPYASFYAGFADFHLWRLSPRGALLVAGFGRAAKLRPAQLAPDPAVAAAIAEAEPAIIAHCNDHHADALARIAGEPGDWRMATVDVDGCDLAQSERVMRVHWPHAVGSPGDVRRELTELARSPA